ncbi:hypothetical protein PAEN110709_21880 [Paenibacillus endophyticus]
MHECMDDLIIRWVALNVDLITFGATHYSCKRLLKRLSFMSKLAADPLLVCLAYAGHIERAKAHRITYLE